MAGRIKNRKNKKRCKYVLKTGRKCLFNAIIGGYCLTHYLILLRKIEKKKNMKKRKKERFLKRTG